MASRRDSIEVVGRRFGRYLVLERRGLVKRVQYWLCRCDCGSEREVRGTDLRSGNVQSCGCLHREKHRAAITKAPGVCATNKVLGFYKRNAAKRNVEWKLDDETFSALLDGNCFYCGSPPTKVSKAVGGNRLYNGIDRVDNGQGYTKGNCVSCCRTCNIAKSDLSFEEFKEWILRSPTR